MFYFLSRGFLYHLRPARRPCARVVTPACPGAGDSYPGCMVLDLRDLAVYRHRSHDRHVTVKSFRLPLHWTSGTGTARHVGHFAPAHAAHAGGCRLRLFAWPSALSSLSAPPAKPTPHAAILDG